MEMKNEHAFYSSVKNPARFLKLQERYSIFFTKKGYFIQKKISGRRKSE
jgi:hypothetical protein